MNNRKNNGLSWLFSVAGVLIMLVIGIGVYVVAHVLSLRKDMTQERLRKALFLLVFKTQLHRLVSVRFHGFALDDPIGAGQHDRDGHQDSGFVVDAGLADFFSE